MGFYMIKKSSQDNNNQLIKDLLLALEDLGGWGSIEVFVQNGKVTQITKRAIQKINHSLELTLDNPTNIV